ncbi:hypothetical protein C8R44DRAFT_876192 [Mycena epipterygia]|nr:hypothetical protein C8R44DRAFT_876192 [Mycena epipterygia]
MAPTFSSLLSKGLQALMHLVQLLFGHHTVKDVEAGGVAVHSLPIKKEIVVRDAVDTYSPTLAGIPALTLASMAKAESRAKPVGLAKNIRDRSPLQTTINTPRRVHGQTPPRQRNKALKENLRDHPNVPRRPQLPPSPLYPIVVINREIVPGRLVSPIEVTPKAAEPGSSEWERQKNNHLQEARAWSDAVKDRHRSLPIPPPSPSLPVAMSPQLARRASAPARLPLRERLRRAVSKSTAPIIKVAPLWGDAHVSFVLDEDKVDEGGLDLPAREVPRHADGVHGDAAFVASSSTSSISSILDTFEGEFTTPAWLGLRSLADLEEGRLGRRQEEEDDGDHWSDVVSLEDYV